MSSSFHGTWRAFIKCVISFIFFDYIQNTLEKTIPENNYDVCRTTECIRIAKLLKQNMKIDADPCDDFYKFSCGNYGEKTIKVGFGSFDEVGNLTFTQILSIIGDISQSDIRPLQMASEFYKSCTRDETAKVIGVRPIRDKLLDLGKWPLSDMKKESSWIDTICTSRDLGFFPDYIVSLAIIFNPRNNTELILAVAPPSLGLPASILQQGPFNPTVQKYMEFMMLICIEFQALNTDLASDVSIQEKLMEVEQLFFFELKLAQISPLILDPPEELLSLEIATSKKLEQQYPAIKWEKLIQSILGPVLPINGSQKVGVLSPKFMTALGSLLETTPNRVIVNYIIWRSIFFSLKIIFAIGTEPRWRLCTSWTLNGFSDVLGPEYVKKYFRQEKRQGVEEMVDRIKEQMRESLSKTTWIDNVTREHALDKLEAMTAVVGYSDDIMNRDYETINAYKNLHISANNYYESFLNLTKFSYDQEILLLRQSGRNRIASSISPASINAFYIPSENTMVIPAAILQSLFYSVDRPNYVNYGTVGFITGHELTHAFDNYGRNFDKYGNYKNWWQPETTAKYKDRIKCFVDQYNHYYLEEINKFIDGILTLGENIADNEGIKTAYRAYKSWLSEHGIEKNLPGLNFTHEQLFWISAANVWCAQYTPAFLNLMVMIDNHAPAMIRVNGQMANQKEFAADFSCPVGSRMNPKEKCLFW